MAMGTCRDCGLQVSTEAASCPRCGRVFTKQAATHYGCGTLAVLGLVGFMVMLCQGESQQTPEQRDAALERRIESDLEYSTRETVKSMLRDPASARFGTVVVVSKDGARTVCGSVNAKNGFGGYAGEQAFMGRNGVVTMRTGENSRTFLRQWAQWCTR
jgi:hypothetical protein